MREQVSSPVLPSPFDRKGASVKLPGKDERENGRRLNDGYVTVFGGNIVNMPGDRVRGGDSINYSKGQGFENSHPEASSEKTKDEVEEDNGNEGSKKRGGEDGLLLQWGDRKRPRCTRLEPKAVTEESSILTKKTIRVDRRVVKAEKQQLVSQTPVVRGHLIRPGTGANGVIRRNTQDYTASVNGVSTSNTCSSADARRLITAATDRAEMKAPVRSPEKQEAAAQSRDDESPPTEARALTTNIPNGGEAAMPAVPAPLVKVDINAFEWPRVLISLSRKEKEDDFMAMKGTKLPQRPKRRPKTVEKSLHYCTPGNWLSDLTRGRYEVREKKSVKKKPRGLKAMDSMESDSE